MCIIVCDDNQYVTVDENLFSVLTGDRGEALEFETHEEAQECIDKDLSGEDRLKVDHIEDVITAVHIDTDKNGQKIYADVGEEKGVKIRFCSNVEFDYQFKEKDFIGLTEIEAWNFICSKEKDLLSENNIKIGRVDGYECMGAASPTTEKQIKEEIHNLQLCKVEDWCHIEAQDKSGILFGYGDKKKAKVIRYLSSKDKEKQSIQWQNCKNRKERKHLKMMCRSIEQKIRTYYNVRNKYVGKNDVIEIFARIGRFAWCNERWYDHIKKDWFLEGMNWVFGDESYATIFAKIKGKEEK